MCVCVCVCVCVHEGGRDGEREREKERKRPGFCHSKRNIVLKFISVNTPQVFEQDPHRIHHVISQAQPRPLCCPVQDS